MGKFKLPKLPTYTVKSIRFPDEVIEDIEKEIAGTNYSFSAFVVEASKNALEDLKEI